jgi:hypothetical protein
VKVHVELEKAVSRLVEGLPHFTKVALEASEILVRGATGAKGCEFALQSNSGFTEIVDFLFGQLALQENPTQDTRQVRGDVCPIALPNLHNARKR